MLASIIVLGIKYRIVTFFQLINIIFASNGNVVLSTVIRDLFYYFLIFITGYKVDCD